MAEIRVINGIGKAKLVCTPLGDAPVITIILPLTMQGGYSEIWDDETFTDRYINADFSVKTITEVQTIIDGFGNWGFDYSGIPLPNTFVQNCALIWNIRDRYTFTLYPKYEDYIGIPARSFEVNFIGAEGLQFVTGDSVYSPGTFGVKLRFRTKTNQKISLGIAPGVAGVLPGGGNVVTPIEGGM